MRFSGGFVIYTKFHCEKKKILPFMIKVLNRSSFWNHVNSKFTLTISKKALKTKTFNNYEVSENRTICF